MWEMQTPYAQMSPSWPLYGEHLKPQSTPLTSFSPWFWYVLLVCTVHGTHGRVRLPALDETLGPETLHHTD